MVSKQFYKERMILCGDSAHICSPLGGQGMNCGWLGAQHLSEAFDKIFNKKEIIEKSLREYEKIQWKLGTATVNRSELNLLIGRKPKYLWLRNIIVAVLLIKPLQYYYSSYIGMRYLGYFSIGKRVFV
jgi:2-polyprenyl-6-methoxyphenol hydroxylase-like FAD-dependent oxidoreductase